MNPSAGAAPRVPHPRRVAIIVWAVMAGILLAFLAMEQALHAAPGSTRAPRGLLFALAVVTSALGIALSRLMPPRIPARQAGGRPAAVALLRLVIAWGLCEGAALFAMAAHLLTHDARLLGVFAVDLLALLTLYPGEEAWTRLSVDAGSGRPDRPAGPGRTER